MYYIEETTCDIAWTLWRPRSHSALPVVIRRPHSDSEPGALCRPSLRPATVLMSAGFEKKKEIAALWQMKTSFLNFRPKLDDCMFKVFS